MQQLPSPLSLLQHVWVQLRLQELQGLLAMQLQITAMRLVLLLLRMVLCPACLSIGLLRAHQALLLPLLEMT